MGIGFAVLVQVVLLTPCTLVASFYLVNRFYPFIQEKWWSSSGPKGCLLAVAIGLACSIGIPMTGAFFKLYIIETSHSHIAPTPSDLVGVYRMSESSHTNAINYGHFKSLSTTLELRSDSTFVLTDMPDYWLSEWNRSSGRAENGIGKWSIDRSGDYPGLELDFSRIDDDTRGHATLMTYFRGEKAPFSIVFCIGDPDNGNSDDLVFEKQ